MIMTHGHRSDFYVVQKFLELRSQPFLRVIGSRSKAVTLKKELKKEGLKQKQIEKLFCPLGFLLEESSSEIACKYYSPVTELRQAFWQNSHPKPCSGIEVYKLNLELPDWIDTFWPSIQQLFLPLKLRCVSFSILLSGISVKKTGGPFGASVFEKESGKLVSVGVNVVVDQNCSATHAEMMALMLAQKKIGHYDLGDTRFPAHRLVTSGKMCAMCLGNVCWSGIKEVVSSC